MDMPDMPQRPERRREENRGQSILVDLGVTYRRTLGDSVAWAFFTANDITPAVANRVMAQDGQRRLTDWERHTMRMAQLHPQARQTDPAM